jgi:hypothetical protein
MYGDVNDPVRLRRQVGGGGDALPCLAGPAGLHPVSRDIAVIDQRIPHRIRTLLLSRTARRARQAPGAAASWAQSQCLLVSGDPVEPHPSGSPVSAWNGSLKGSAASGSAGRSRTLIATNQGSRGSSLSRLGWTASTRRLAGTVWRRSGSV